MLICMDKKENEQHVTYWVCVLVPFPLRPLAACSIFNFFSRLMSLLTDTMINVSGGGTSLFVFDSNCFFHFYCLGLRRTTAAGEAGGLLVGAA